MRTTIALDSAHRDRLLELKEKWGLRSVDDVVARLLQGGAETAITLYRRHRKAVDAVLSQRRVRRAVAFGSRARGEGRPDSDLDLAVELPRDADLFDLVVLRAELSEAFGIDVDVVELAALRPHVRKRVNQEGVPLRAAA